MKSEGWGKRMKYVYILESQSHPNTFYTAITGDVQARLKRHDAGAVTHTSKFVPWTLKSYVAFASEKQAYAFERYLKSGSDRAFAKKHL